MGTTKDVLDHHLKSLGAGDLKGILSDYAPDAVLFTPGGPLKGTDTIRPPLCEAENRGPVIRRQDYPKG